MVVHLEDTPAADRAVVGAGGFGGDALLTDRHTLWNNLAIWKKIMYNILKIFYIKND